MRRAVQGRVVRSKTRSVKRVPRNTRKPNWGFLCATFSLSALVSCAVSYALQTPLLNVKEVSISGVKLGDKAVVKAAAKYALGKNIILVRKGQALVRIGDLAEVADVRMGRTFPDKLWIEVVERVPYALLTNGTQYYMTQEDGRLFHEVGGPVSGLPVVELGPSERLELGKNTCSPRAQSALDALKSARHEGLEVAKISFDHDGNMCLNMDSKFCVKLGQPDEIENKMSLVHSALNHRPSIVREADYVDVSCPSAPVWKPKSPVQAAL